MFFYGVNKKNAKTLFFGEEKQSNEATQLNTNVIIRVTSLFLVLLSSA